MELKLYTPNGHTPLLQIKYNAYYILYSYFSTKLSRSKNMLFWILDSGVEVIS